MRLVPNAKRIAWKAYSMWANYLGIAALVLPELLFVLAGIDTNPAIWFFLGLSLIILGIVGRIVDQKDVD